MPIYNIEIAGDLNGNAYVNNLKRAIEQGRYPQEDVQFNLIIKDNRSLQTIPRRISSLKRLGSYPNFPDHVVSLSLIDVPAIGNLNNINIFPNLEELIVRGIRTSLKNLTLDQSLDLSKLKIIEIRGEYQMKVRFDINERFTGLETLVLNNVELDDPKKLELLVNLRIFSLKYVRNIVTDGSDFALIHKLNLRTFQNLRIFRNIVELADDKLKSKSIRIDMESLSELPNLEELDIS